MTDNDRKYIRDLVKELLEKNNVQGARELFDKLMIVYDEDIIEIIEGEIVKAIEKEAVNNLINESKNTGIAQGKVDWKRWKCDIMEDRLVVDFDGYEMGVIFDASVIRDGSSKLKIEDQLLEDYSLFDQLRHEFNSCPLRINATVKVVSGEELYLKHIISFGLSSSYMNKYDVNMVTNHLMHVGIEHGRSTQAVAKVIRNGDINYRYASDYQRRDRRCTCAINRTVHSEKELENKLKDNLDIILHRLFYSMYKVKYK